MVKRKLSRAGILFFALLFPLFFSCGQQVILQDNPESENFGQLAVTVISPKILTILDHTSLTPNQWREVLALWIGTDRSRPNIAGTWSQEDNALRFQPLFDLLPGQAYTARYDQKRLGELLHLEVPPLILVDTFLIPSPESEVFTRITEISPGSDTVPSNILKIYIHFSSPMGLENPYTFLSLHDDEGALIKDSFVEVSDGLWNRDHTRLTVFFHPGRIKREVGPNKSMGPVFEEGKTYELRIDGQWKDAYGSTLAKDFSKRFYVTGVDRSPVKPEQWEVIPPALHSRKPLKIRFGESLDRALAQRMITITNMDSIPITGDNVVNDQVSEWTFIPKKPWSGDKLLIRIDSRLEDLAGNTLIAVFDQEILGDQARRSVEKYEYLEVTLK